MKRILTLGLLIVTTAHLSGEIRIEGLLDDGNKKTPCVFILPHDAHQAHVWDGINLEITNINSTDTHATLDINIVQHTTIKNTTITVPLNKLQMIEADNDTIIFFFKALH